MKRPTSHLVRLLTGTLAVGLTLSLVSCGGGTPSVSGSTSDMASSVCDTPAVPEKTQIQLYYADAQSDFLQTCMVELDELSPQAVLQALQADGLVDKNVTVLNWLCENQADPNKDTTLTLDLSKEFQEQLSVNPSTEHTLLACVVNTYLDAYEAVSITLTSDGKPLTAQTEATNQPFSYLNPAVEPTFPQEITIAGKQQVITLTWLTGSDCAVGYDAQRMTPDPLSSVAPIALCGKDSREITFTVAESDSALSDVIAQVKKNMGKDVTEETVRLGWDSLNATCLTSSKEQNTLERRYLLESGGRVWVIAYQLPTSQQAALQPVLDAMANTFRVLPIVN